MCNPSLDDWRRHSQEKYLKGARLIVRDYSPYRTGWDHDHCAFCGDKFSVLDGDIKQGYATIDFYYWICNQCFNDFKNEFNWQIDVINK